MPGLNSVPPDVTTVHLGEFTREHANDIAAELEARHITWWYKEPGYLATLWESGVRVFVDRAHLDEANEIAREVLARDAPPAD